MFRASHYFILLIISLVSMSVFADAAAISHRFRAGQSALEVYKDKKGWQPLFIKGVNIGAAKPGSFPGEMAITQTEYSRWFRYIAKMNANTIRVYTTQSPVFYQAFYDYNRLNPAKPLYLFQGVWINEDDIAALKDPYAANEKIKTDFIADTKALIDIIHGNATIPVKPGHAGGQYTSDVSKYVIGWILGIEWDPYWVTNTNNLHPDKTNFEGKFIFTDHASPFEVFLAEVADAVVVYESERYSEQRLLSFTNWLTTDMLSHPNEPLAGEDMVTVNIEHLNADRTFLPGLFASYHIYPYYPDFMSYQHDYQEFHDVDGKINSYKAYLRDLHKQHTMPVLVAEFGIPASRGMAHINSNTGFNQGNVTEQQQGDMDARMLKDMHDEGYAGGLVFAWQDEWFKRTWNTVDFDLPDQRPFWSNAQTNEQAFGLLSFDPGIKDICRIDGSVSDWRGSKPIFQGNGVKLHAKSDEKYVYLMAEVPGFDFEKDTLLIPIDTIANQGSSTLGNTAMTFSRDADFLISLHGKDDSRIKVEAYYDAFYFINAIKHDYIEQNPDYELTNTGLFVPMQLTLSRKLFLPEDQLQLPFTSYETGKLRYGDGNPTHPAFNSLTDFAYRQHKFEIRIPWQLLNVMDPSTKQLMANLRSNNGIVAEAANAFYFGAAIVKPESTPQLVGSGEFNWNPWTMPTYHERLKRSYGILQKAFAKYK
ncbi:MAG: hypothetical protein ABL919_05790 [Methylococcales bacterium]|nr:family 2 glycosyl transferase [Methylococcaceae bacterium]